MYESESLECVACHEPYHYQCLNVTSAYFREHGKELKRKWRCEKCTNVTSRRKGDETPITPNMKQMLASSQDDASLSFECGLSESISAVASKTQFSTVTDMGALVEYFESKFEKIGTKLDNLQTAIPMDIKNELNRAIQQVKVEFTQTTDFLSNQISDLKAEITSTNAKMKTLENELGTLKSQSSAVREALALKETMAELRQELNDREQAGLSNDLEIAGIPEYQNESLVHLVSVVASKLGVHLDMKDVVNVQRVGRKPDLKGEGRATGVPPRRIVVRLARCPLRDDLLRAARVRRHIKTDDFNLPDHEPRRVYINERLTKHYRVLFARAREAGNSCGWKFIWTRNGCIYAKRTELSNAPVHRLRTEDDLQRVFVKPSNNSGT